jgi:hypothetical protein
MKIMSKFEWQSQNSSLRKIYTFKCLYLYQKGKGLHIEKSCIKDQTLNVSRRKEIIKNINQWDKKQIINKNLKPTVDSL